MNSKSLLILVAATGLAAAGAALALKNRESAVTVAREPGRFLPDLIGSLNDVAAVSVKTGEGAFTLERRDGAWTLAEKGGYPAEEEPIRKLLIGIAELQKVEPKTDDPERWSKLGVEDPTSEDAASKLVTLKNSAGAELASLVVGNARPSQGGRRVKQLYVRKSGDDQSWLVAGEVDLKTKESDWLQKEIYAIEQDRIQAIEIEHADGETLHVRKESQDAVNFDVLDIPEGRELRWPTVANPLAGNVRNMKLEDVRPAGEIDVEDGWLSRTTVRTFDGLTLVATLKDVDGKSWVTFAAAYVPDADESEADEDGEEPVAEVTRSPSELQAEADELEARFAGWVYSISQYGRTSLTKRMSDMLKEPVPDEDESALGGDDRPLVIPDTLPPEIQEQIKAHQASLGNKTVVRSPEASEGDGDDESTDADPDASAEAKSGNDDGDA